MYSIRLIQLRDGIIKASVSSNLGKNLLPLSGSRAIVTTTPTVNLKAQTAEDYWTKNQRLKRPISPHLTIYKPQVTSVLSLTHRGTGIYLSTLVSGFSIGMLALPESFPHYLSVIEATHYGGALIFLAKFSIAFPFMFHLINGVRHLVWDLGYGFTLRTLYKSGYLVLGISIALSGFLSSL